MILLGQTLYWLYVFFGIRTAKSLRNLLGEMQGKFQMWNIFRRHSSGSAISCYIRSFNPMLVTVSLPRVRDSVRAPRIVFAPGTEEPCTGAGDIFGDYHQLRSLLYWILFYKLRSCISSSGEHFLAVVADDTKDRTAERKIALALIFCFLRTMHDVLFLITNIFSVVKVKLECQDESFSSTSSFQQYN